MRSVLKVLNWPSEYRALGARLGPGNSTLRLLQFFLFQKLRRRRTVALRVLGELVHLRTMTPDLRVALTSIGGEFRELKQFAPGDGKGLIIDAGAYIGTAAIALARMYPQATIVCLEPSLGNFEILKLNVSRLRNVQIERAALVPEGHTGRIELMDVGTGEWGFTIVNRPNDQSARPVEQVDAVSIEDVLQKYNFNQIMILKMDIEGAELELLQRSAWLDKVAVFMIELHERIVPGCKQAFHNANVSRTVYRSGGEKFISVASARHAGSCSS